MSTQCSATTKAGTRCRQASTVGESGLCLHHDPAQKRQVTAARSRGGKNSAKAKMAQRVRTVDASEAPPNPTTIAECVAYASWALGAVTTGAIDSRTAHEISVLLAQIQRGLKDSKLVDDVAALREQIAELSKASR